MTRKPSWCDWISLLLVLIFSIFDREAWLSFRMAGMFLSGMGLALCMGEYKDWLEAELNRLRAEQGERGVSS